MTATSRRSRTATLGAAVLAPVIAVTLVGCGGSSKAGSGSSSTAPAGSASAGAASDAKDATIAAMVPAAVRTSGTLNVATEGAYAPFELFAADNKTLTGVDPELATAIAAVMGLKVNLVNTKFDSIIPGLQAGRYNLGMAAFGDTKVREKVVDFVTYFKGGSSLMVLAGNPQKLTLTTLCGKKIAIEKGTIYESAVVPQLSAACTKAGKPAIATSVFPGQPEATLALSSGRADGTISDYAPMAYVAKRSNNKFEVIPQQYQPIPWGIAMPKGSGMTKPVLAAVKKLMADGTYAKVLKKWDVSVGAITDPAIDAAIG